MNQCGSDCVLESNQLPDGTFNIAVTGYGKAVIESVRNEFLRLANDFCGEGHFDILNYHEPFGISHSGEFRKATGNVKCLN